MKKSDLIGYAHAYVSFVLPRISTAVKEIILFGSVARGDFDEKSDMDIFFDVINEKEIKTVERELRIVEQKFTKSKIFELWRQKGVVNRIKTQV